MLADLPAAAAEADLQRLAGPSIQAAAPGTRLFAVVDNKQVLEVNISR